MVCCWSLSPLSALNLLHNHQRGPRQASVAGRQTGVEEVECSFCILALAKKKQDFSAPSTNPATKAFIFNILTTLYKIAIAKTLT